MQCCGADPEGVAGAAAATPRRIRRDATYLPDWRGDGVGALPCPQHAAQRGAPRRAASDEANFNYWVNDWLLLAPSRTLDSFAAISDRIDDYRDGLREVGISIEWMHFFWAAHVHHGLRCADGVRALLRAQRSTSPSPALPSRSGCATNVSAAASLPTYSEPRWGAGCPNASAPCAEPSRASGTR